MPSAEGIISEFLAQLTHEAHLTYNSTSANAVVSPRYIDTSRNEPDPQLETVLRVLQASFASLATTFTI